MNRSINRGQILVGATILVAVMMLLVPLMVQWGRNESRWAVKEQRTVAAFNVTEAAVDRGLWKLKSTTVTWAAAAQGQVVAGYNFDQTHTDIEGGVYRIRFSSGPQVDQVTVLAEGRDNRTRQTRAVRAVFQNMTNPGPLMSAGLIGYAGSFEAHWGPIYAHNTITISGNAATEYFPRKYSKQVVVGTAGQPRDTNGLNPPNTDNTEWWSNYDVPDLPQLDFVTMRASATANGTLNYRTNDGTSGAGKCVGWAGKGRCETGGNTAASHVNASLAHFFNTNDHALSKQNRIWYWDGNVTFTGNTTGPGCYRNGLYGTIIVRGNMTIDAGDCYAYVGPVPADAYEEYTRIKTATSDTASANQYPADNGLRANRLTFNHGGESWTGGPPSANTDVGFRGFIYSGGDLTINSIADLAGTVWVNGNTICNDTSERVLLFYEGNNPNVPVLNVVAKLRTWDEVRPSTITW